MSKQSFKTNSFSFKMFVRTPTQIKVNHKQFNTNFLEGEKIKSVCLTWKVLRNHKIVLC